MACESTEEENFSMFQKAAEWVRNKETLKLSTEQKLKMYGLFKQVQ